MVRFLLSCIVLSFFITLPAIAQLQIEWQQSFGGSDYDEAVDILAADDGFYVLGTTESTDGNVSFLHGKTDFWVVKVDFSGNILWEKTFGGSLGEALEDGFRAYNSNDIYLVGWSASSDGDITYNPFPDVNSIWIVRLDDAGNKLWDTKVGGPYGFWYNCLGSPTSDGGVVCGLQSSYQGGNITTYYGGWDAWTIKLDSTGGVDWDFTIGSSGSEFINEIIQTSDGGYIAGVYGMPSGSGGNIECQSINYSSEGILFKMDSASNKEWSRCYGGSAHDGIRTLLELSDGYLVAGFTESSDGDLLNSGYHADVDVWLLRLDTVGNVVWSKCFGGSKAEYPQEIFQTAEGDFVVFANSESSDGDVVGNFLNGAYCYSTIWVIKVSAEGELIWQQCIGSKAEEGVYGVSKFDNNHYAIAGYMTLSPSGDVNCSNFVLGSERNYWAFELTDLTVGEQEPPPLGDIRLYPDPVDDFLTVSIPADRPAENISAEIVSAEGKTVMTFHPGTAETRLDIRQLPPGIYIVKILQAQSLYTSRIIVY